MRVAIIHPWFPQYRVGFFEGLVARAAEVGIEIKIFHGDSPPEWKDRNDGASSQEFIRLPTRFFNLRGRTLNHKSLKPFRSQGRFDLVIVEQAVRNLETYELLLWGARLAYWGHGKTYTIPVSAAQERLKQWLTRKGRWFFAYTIGGLDAVSAAGYPRERGTVVQNSIDTSVLKSEIAEIGVETLQGFTRRHDLRGKTALYIGGLDSSKRLDFLIDAVELAHEIDPDFRLLLAGSGTERHKVEARARELPFVTYLGSLFGPDKALAIKASEIMAMPGRVGLVAVDSFAGGTPIVTTNWAWHAPEFEYLEAGVNSVITGNDEGTYALALIETVNDTAALAALSIACEEASTKYTVEAMVRNFVQGIQKVLVERK
ncbi:glycosyltransferase family 4 protein [Cryobacterium sp. Y11]|uniref:glycosyltransferase family 4 protein n=1 Tax=Cryobacterium sp. Y11 TaxID=2045016 RepID=UPI000CE3B6C1|nr:glycosyltransferase [Cryobacterium sp. Y11]